MRTAIALLVVGLCVTGIVAVARAVGADTTTCSLPSGIPVACLGDADCAPYGAVCDLTQGFCVCSAVDGGAADGGGGTVVDAAVAPPPAGGSSNGGSEPSQGGGMTAPPRTGGCSFVPR